MHQMDLFNNSTQQNILPYDGEVIYFGTIFPKEEADAYMQALLKNIKWKNDEAVIFGKHLVTPRKVAWYGDNAFSYSYSGSTKHALEWTKELIILKSIVEKNTGTTFNSCLLNLYHHGKEGMAYHSDDEKVLGRHTTIASLTFGATRKFLFKHKVTRACIPMMLENGSLMIMKGETQTHWLHRLPPTTKINSPRVNLTFRTIVTNK